MIDNKIRDLKSDFLRGDVTFKTISLWWIGIGRWHIFSF